MRMILPLLTTAMLAACVPPPETEFMDRLNALCGQSFLGEIVSDDPEDEDWRGQTIIVEIAECSPTEVRMPLAVGDDTSRTWIVTRTSDGGLELRHQHLHEDGTPDALTNYGGYSDRELQSGSRQNFPASDDTKALFDREGIPVSKQNTWAVEVRPTFMAYEMARPERFFRIEFDTLKPLAPPNE